MSNDKLSAEHALTCHDGRRPVDLYSPHGVHHWQARLPLTRRWHLCLTATSGRYFVPMIERRDGVARIALRFAAVALVRRPARPSVSYMRWCAHINVTADVRTSPGKSTEQATREENAR